MFSQLISSPPFPKEGQGWFVKNNVSTYFLYLSLFLLFLLPEQTEQTAALPDGGGTTMETVEELIS